MYGLVTLCFGIMVFISAVGVYGSYLIVNSDDPKFTEPVITLKDAFTWFFAGTLIASVWFGSLIIGHIQEYFHNKKPRQTLSKEGKPE